MRISLYWQGHITISLWTELGNIHYELKIDKQGL